MTAPSLQSAAAFLSMGGYGFYVWGAYALTAAMLGLETWLATRRLHRAAGAAIVSSSDSSSVSGSASAATAASASTAASTAASVAAAAAPAAERGLRR